MFSLIAATLCSASIALLFKFSAVKGLDQPLLTVSNYFMASIISLSLIILEDNAGLIDFKSGPFINTLTLGIGTGVFFLLSFVFYQMSVSRNGASLSGMFAKLGILIPMIISIIAWKEIPTQIQGVGIGIALVAIAIANMNPKQRKQKSDSLLILIALFTFGGLGEFFNKVFQRSTSLAYKPIFLFCVFVTALCISLFLHFRRSGKVKMPVKSMVLGLVVGVPNLFASFFLLDALNTFSTSIVFSAYSAGSILLISIFSVVLFHEKLLKKDIMAIALTSISLVLLNL